MVPKIQQAAGRCGVEAAVEMTGTAGHAQQLAQQYAQQGDEVRLYAVGGDGTLNEVLQGAYPYANAAVGSVPCGSGNDFVRNFGQVKDFLDIEQLLAGQAVDIDLIDTGRGICAAITSTGLDAEVAYGLPRYRRVPLLGGTMGYKMSIVERLLHRLGRQLRVVLDGEQAVEGRFLIAAVCNGRTYGGGFWAAPEASLRDGMLDVILVRKISRLLIAQIIGVYKQGKHFENGRLTERFQKYIQHFRVKEVEITPLADEPFILNIDGECGPARRLCAKVMPGAGRFILPKALALRYEEKHTPA